MIEGDVLRNYVIQKDVASNYDFYHIVVEGINKYCYYEKKDNVYVDKVYFVVGKCNQDFNFLENSIYMFFNDVKDLKEIVSILNLEFSNLEYFFIMMDNSWKDLIAKICSSLNLKCKILEKDEYLNQNNTFKKVSVNPEYSDYDIQDNVYLDHDEEKEQNELEGKIKNFVNYNGYNERLIDDNVKNIVHVRKGNGGKNE